MLNKKMLLSVLIVGVVASVAGAGTWAAFSDTETSTGNTFTAGTLDLQLTGKQVPATTSFTVSNVVPSANSVSLGTLKLINGGNINGNLVAKIININDDENGEANDAEHDADTTVGGDLGSVLELTISDGTNTFIGTPAELTSMDFGLINTGKEITVSYKVPQTVGNEIQGDIVGFDIEFTLTQA
jgi:predicted ribosomally synthesized peptide with SipW-like signal peptide